MNQNLSQEENEQLAIILRYLGAARIETYRKACDGSDASSIALYEWNLRLSAAFQEILLTLEVAFRNAIDEQLSSWNLAQSGNTRNQGRVFTDDWIADPAIPLHGMMQDAVAEATRQARASSGKRQRTHPRHKIPPTHDDILAQISFGKWTALMPFNYRGRPRTIEYRALWDEALHKAFPHAPQGEHGMSCHDVVRHAFVGE